MRDTFSDIGFAPNTFLATVRGHVLLCRCIALMAELGIADGLADPDHDGLPTWMELRLGLNPNSVSPGFSLALTQMTPDGPTLQFGPGGTNLTYRLLTTPDPGSSWNILSEFNSGETPSSLYQLTDTNAPFLRSFYRLQVLEGGQ